MKRNMQRVAAWGASIVGSIIAGLIVWRLTLPEPPPPPGPEIHSKGTKTIKLERLHIPPSSPNESGPFFHVHIDLDRGVEVGSGPKDISLAIHDETLSINASRGVEVGTADGGYEVCRELLATSKSNLVTQLTQPPTGYVCLETDEGRISLFRVLSMSPRAAAGGQHMFNIDVQYEYTTWKWK